MDMPQTDGQKITVKSRGAIVRWLLTDRVPRSALGILAVSLALWVSAFALAYLGPQSAYGLWENLCVMIACVGGFMGISGLGRIRRDLRKATTAKRKAATILAILPLAAMAGLSLLIFGVIVASIVSRAAR